MDGLLIVVAVASGIAVLVLGLADHDTWPLSTLGFLALTVSALLGKALWAPLIGVVIIAAAELVVPVGRGDGTPRPTEGSPPSARESEPSKT
jgi:hypothetical protein